MKNSVRIKKCIYLDYAATTPVDMRVARAMEPYFGVTGGKFGNPGSLHSFGQEAIAAVDRARETIAKSIGAEFREIIFTGTATEANNLALRGIVGTLRMANAGLKDGQNPRVIVSTIEHESILETARDLERDGVEVIYLPVNTHGIVDLEKMKASLNERTILVSVMYANNEIGVIQPISKIAKIIQEFRNRQSPTGNRLPVFHTDAAQAFQFFDCDVREIGVDLMTLSSHKIYGPKGAAALFVRGTGGKQKNKSDIAVLRPIIFGGGQEFGLRSGTENVPSLVGFAKAIELVAAVREKESKRIGVLKDYLWRGIKKIYPEAKANGAAPNDAASSGEVLPNILNVYFPDRAAQDLLTRFDLAGLAVSSGSACHSRALEPSYVIKALGAADNWKDRAKSSIRFSLGRPTARQDAAAALKIIKEVLN